MLGNNIKTSRHFAMHVQEKRCNLEVPRQQKSKSPSIKDETTVLRNQFGFMPGRSTSTIETIFLDILWKNIKKSEKISTWFLLTKIMYDRVARADMWWVLEKEF